MIVLVDVVVTASTTNLSERLESSISYYFELADKETSFLITRFCWSLYPFYLIDESTVSYVNSPVITVYSWNIDGYLIVNSA
ncbi:hypothetical protein VCR26J2_50001 [Vibrio coralliirubri]|nr:hypothetical protein VCR6J2_460001 [Vibrio coralliirubri]CDT56823.1 hypothetical protein VCR1J2_620001 [Vibrio coralliirubri]CDT89099.1 hypothetical protein VCR26J2_50001 [Vibrio coralliirubri]CDT96050.1 hypothetical protein VCR8J2_500001 [Vibrio coralliirubri]